MLTVSINMSCKICLEDTGTLISPCKCKGSSAYVHSECLEEWLNVSKRTSCEICQHEYQLKDTYKCNVERMCSLIVQCGVDELLHERLIASVMMFSLLEMIVYLSFQYEQYFFVSTAFTCLIFLWTIFLYATGSYDYIHNFAVRLYGTSLFVTFLFVFMSYSEQRALQVACATCVSIQDRCSFECPRTLSRSRKIVDIMNDIVLQGCITLGVLVVLKIVVDIFISAKTKSVVEDEEEIPLVTDMEV